jgi:hypothetical protein
VQALIDVELSHAASQYALASAELSEEENYHIFMAMQLDYMRRCSEIDTLNRTIERHAEQHSNRIEDFVSKRDAAIVQLQRGFSSLPRALRCALTRARPRRSFAQSGETRRAAAQRSTPGWFAVCVVRVLRVR